MRLLDPSGQNVLGTGVAEIDGIETSNFDLVIADFVVPSDGIYILEVDSSVSSQYAVVVSHALVELEPNDSDDQGRMLADGIRAIGEVSMGASVASDPEGDNIAAPEAQYDIVGLTGSVVDDVLEVLIEFNDPIEIVPGADNGPFVYFEFDTDQDPQTGTDSLQNQGFVPGQLGGPLGIEYVVQVDAIFNQTVVVNTVSNSVIDGTVDYSFEGEFFSVSIPLELIGNPEEFNFGFLTGTFSSVTDAAPNDTVFEVAEGGTGGSDTYQIQLAAGQTILLESEATHLPTGRPNNLETAFELKNSEGAVVGVSHATGANGGAALAFTSEAGGEYSLTIASADAQGSYSVKYDTIAPNAVVGRHFLYNDSVADGNNPAANADDDAAIATDKTALLPEHSFGLANYSSSRQGLNGVVIDILGGGEALTGDDFELRIGNSDQLENWTQAPDPTAVAVRPGAGTAGSNRVTLTWSDHAIENTWLEVTVLANDNTGLTSPDVFYFGHLAGETGDQPGQANVSTVDVLGTRYHLGTSTVDSETFRRFDFNLDGVVDELDTQFALSSTDRSLAAPFPNMIPMPDPPSRYGDTNLDGVFDTVDLVSAFQLGEFEDALSLNSTWDEGDWDGDGDFTTRDLVFAFQQGFFQDAPNAVPQLALPTDAIELTFMQDKAADEKDKDGGDPTDQGEWNLRVRQLFGT